MRKIFVTSDFCNASKKLISRNKLQEVHDLRTVLILLANDKPIPKKYKDHNLKGNDFRELHISGDTLLLYRYESDSGSLVVSLKLANITDHKSLSKDASRTDYAYKEVSTQELHDITSSADLDSSYSEFLNDVLESVSDYASMNMNSGYVLLSDYYIIGSELHCEYDYVSYDTNLVTDQIDYVINLEKYASSNIYELEDYIHDFAEEILHSFE